MKIPKRIIQTGKSRDLSPLHRAAVSSLKSLHPDFDYLFFTNEDVFAFVESNYSDIYGLFASLPQDIMRYDLFRYCVVHSLGGFYFDLDVLMSCRLEELLDKECVFPCERIGINRYLKESFGMDWDLGNYAFGASAGTTFLGAVIDNCLKAFQDPRWTKLMLDSIPWLFRKDAFVLCTTGPGLVSRTYAENPHLRSSVTVLCPGDISNRAHWNQFGKYGIHLMESSWRERRGRLFRAIWNTHYSRVERRNIERYRIRRENPDECLHWDNIEPLESADSRVG